MKPTYRPAIVVALGLTGCTATTSQSPPHQLSPIAAATPANDRAGLLNGSDVPGVVLASMNINAGPKAGPNGSALYVHDVENGAMLALPFSTIAGRPIVGSADGLDTPHGLYLRPLARSIASKCANHDRQRRPEPHGHVRNGPVDGT